jgi:hypothetical protein
LCQLDALLSQVRLKANRTQLQGNDGFIARRNHPLVPGPVRAAVLVPAAQAPITNCVTILVAEALCLIEDVARIASATGVVGLTPARWSTTRPGVRVPVPVSITIVAGRSVAIACGAARMVAVSVSIALPQLFLFT